MTCTYQIKARGGLENFIRLSATLNRRQFEIRRITLVNLDRERFEMEVSLDVSADHWDRALRILKKNEDVELIEREWEE